MTWPNQPNQPNQQTPEIYTESWKRWRQQPWFRDARRSAVRLTYAQDDHWPRGFFIYRTVYTPESDQVWSACLEQLDRYVRWEIGDRYAEAEDHGFPERLIRETYKNVILEDKERWDGASIEQIREVRAFEDPEERGGGPGKGFVLMIDPECSPGHRKEGYYGFVRVEIDTLFLADGGVKHVYFDE